MNQQSVSLNTLAIDNRNTSIPEGWFRTRLSRVVTFKNGADYRDVESASPGYPVYGSGGRFKWATEWLHDGPSVLFGRKGTINRPLYVDEKFWTIDTMYYSVPNQSLVAPKFLYYWATRIPFAYYATDTALPSITQGDLGSEELLLPPLSEQQQIADYLDHETAEIDAFIMDLDSFISLLHESLGAIRSELFGKPTTHETISLKRLARQVSGSDFPHDYQGDPAQEIPFFKVGSLKDSVDGKLADSPNTVSTSTAKALGAMIFPENTVVLAKIGAALFLNRTARLGKPSCIDNNMLGLIPHPGVNPEFLQGIISNMDLVPLGNPGAVPSLNMAWYREQPAWLPSYTNQQKIVETYRGKKDDISSLITGANRAIGLARERRAALITAAVTGQIDVAAKHKPAAEQIEDDIAQGLHREYA